MRKKNLTKAVETTVAPNPKEVDIWVEPKDDNTVSLKYYDYHDKEWKGGSEGGSSSGSGDNNFKYYKVAQSMPTAPFYNYDETQYLITHMRAQLNGERYMYGTFAGVVRYFGKQTQNPLIDAFAFSPTVLFDSDKGWITIKSYEDAVELYPDVFPPTDYATEITAEEYWEHFNAAQ